MFNNPSKTFAVLISFLSIFSINGTISLVSPEAYVGA